MSDDILKALEQDARRLRVARMLPTEGKLSNELIDDVIGRFQAFCRDNRITITQVSRELGSGFSIATISGIVHGRRLGDVDRIVRGLNSFMEQYSRRQEIPRPSGFVETRVAKRMLTLILRTSQLGSMGVICGPSGIGKTMVARAALSIYKGAILLRVTRSSRVVTGLAQALCEALRIDRKLQRGLYAQQRAIEQDLATSHRLLMVDEAHQLAPEALELLRDLHDQCQIPIVLIGTRLIGDRVKDVDEWYGQFNRRTALKWDLTSDMQRRGGGGGDPRPLFSVDEIRAAFESEKLRLTDDGAEFLTQVSNVLGLGSLGLCYQVVMVAASSFPGEDLDYRRLWKVMVEMQDGDVLSRIRERVRMQAPQAKIA